MKSQYLITTAFATLLAVSGQSNAGEQELNKNEVPKAVLEAFEKANPNATALEFEKEMFEGKTAYEVEAKENGKEYEFLYSVEGGLLQKEEEIDVNMLPKPVVKTIQKAHPNVKIKEAEKLMKPDGTVTGYEVEIKSAKKEAELELDVNGKILKTDTE